jgi:hypothetical protein
MQVIGLQLAVAHGYLMPPHNPYFGKRSISSQPFHKHRQATTPTKQITMIEFKTIERVLLVIPTNNKIYSSKTSMICKFLEFEKNRFQAMFYKINLSDKSRSCDRERYEE